MNPPSKTVLTGLLLSLSLAGCAVGPDFVRPDPPPVDAFIRQESLAAAPAPQPDAEFWRNFGDPLLQQLVDEALQHNADLRIAFASFQQANALLGAAKYEQFPVATGTVSAATERASADQMPGVSRADRNHDDYQANLGFSWELDLFGRIRRGVEAQRAETAARASDLAAMQVAVVGQLAESYFQLRGSQERLRIAHENGNNQARTLHLLQVRLDGGMATPFDVERGRVQLESTLAQIPTLEAEVAVATHRIAVLVGRTPESLATRLEVPGALPRLPADIAAGAPGDLLRRRADVAAAEQRLAASTARIGVATADLFPRFTLGGLIGTQAFDAGALFQRDSETRMLFLGIDGSFLNVGRTRARIAAADAAAAGDLAAYQRTVLVALEETENALVRVSRSGRAAQGLERAAAASARAAQMARFRFDLGAIDVFELLDAQRTHLQAEDAYSQGRLRNTLAVVSLYRALAGGWPGRWPGSDADRVGTAANALAAGQSLRWANTPAARTTEERGAPRAAPARAAAPAAGNP